MALGSNSRLNVMANARQIARVLRCLPGRIGVVSRLFRTPAWPPGSGPDFVNAAALVVSPMPSALFLARLHGIEARFGRVRRERWGARTLDLDLLGSGGLVRPDARVVRHWIDLPADRQIAEAPGQLILPHPRLQDRAFVLVPLAEIAPRWRHPVTGRSVAAMAATLSGARRREIRPVGPVDGVVNTNLRP
nr:2-amino-4-hydroxy-6-hydroxymethyldihydropteridine diphosphokinase [Jannaschia pohangensis]